MGNISYFAEGDGYVALTTESPKGFKGVLLVGKGPLPGGGIDTIREHVWTIEQTKTMTAVDADDVPDEWFNALGYEQRVAIEPEPETVLEPYPIFLDREVIDISWFPFNTGPKIIEPPLSPEDAARLKSVKEAGMLVGIVLFIIITLASR